MNKTIDNTHTFSYKYFLQELGEFRQLCGKQEFMENDKKQDDAIHGLSFVCLNTVNDDGTDLTPEQRETQAFQFNCTMDNYNRRKSMLVMLPLKRYLGLVK